jgi:glycosyltransferase involved in cell wall biosynthesis
MKGTPKLSLCMIARDEERTIGAALRAARPFCDEMIVVDTGSTDHTREIAAELGARVVSEPWQDDFARARNRSLEEARGDFALVLDADEVIDARCGLDVREAISRPDTKGVFLPIVNRFEDGRELVALILRVFPLRADVRFRYRIHEQVVDKLVVIAKRERGRLIQAGGAVLHDGYRKDVIEARGKNERNLRLFELAVADDPSDLYLRYKFADFLRGLPGREARVKELLEDAVSDLERLPRDAVDDLPFAGEVYALLAQAWRDGGDPARGLQCAERGLKIATKTVNLEFIHATIALDLLDLTTAVRGFRACLARAGEVLVMPGQCGTTGVLAELGLARALHALDRSDEARALLQHVADEEPGREGLIEAWLACARATADPAGALRWLTGFLTKNPKEARAWTAGAELLYGMRMFAEARTWFARGADNGSNATVATAWCAECFLHEGKLEDALDMAAAARTDTRAQAVIAAVSMCAGLEVPGLVRSGDADVRAAFRQLLLNLEQTDGAPVVDLIRRHCEAMDVFDPAGVALATAALG